MLKSVPKSAGWVVLVFHLLNMNNSNASFQNYVWLWGYFVNWKGMYTWFYYLLKEMVIIKKSSELKLKLHIGMEKTDSMIRGSLGEYRLWL